MTLLKFFNLRGLSIFEQLCFEEYLLRTTTDNCLVFNTSIGMVNGGARKSSRPTVVVGFSGKPENLVNLEATARDEVPLIRRYTGGGTVVVDHDTVFVSLIMNDKDVPDCLPYPRDIMRWTGDYVYGPLFSSLSRRITSGGDARHPGGLEHMQHVKSGAKFSMVENDYVWGDRKIGGNAQTITKGRWVHHTSFLWDFDPANMQNYLKLPEKRPDYRADRSHSTFLTTLGDKLSFPMDTNRSLNCQFGLDSLAITSGFESTADDSSKPLQSYEQQGGAIAGSNRNNEDARRIQQFARALCGQVQFALGANAVTRCTAAPAVPAAINSDSRNHESKSKSHSPTVVTLTPVTTHGFNSSSAAAARSQVPQRCCWSPAEVPHDERYFRSIFDELQADNPNFQPRTHYIASIKENRPISNSSNGE